MADPIRREYNRPQDKVFNAALQAVQALGYKIDSIDKANGLLTFKTGMSWWSWAGQEMSILIIDNGNNTSTMDITGRRNQKWRSYASL